MRVLVTGSLGVLGTPLSAELAHRGYEVFGCDIRHGADEAESFMRADVGSYRQLRRAFKEFRPQAVYHLAGEFGRHNGNRMVEDVWRTNLIGTHNVCELCSELGAKLIFASSSEIYGELEAETLDEDLPERVPLWQPNEYALSKWANEVQIVNYSRRHDLDAIRLRFFNVYGREPYHPYRSVVSVFCHRALNGIPYEVYEGYSRTFCFIDDFIPTLANALTDARSGEAYNIGGEDYRSISELSELVLIATGADPGLVSYLPEDVHNVRSKRPNNGKARVELGHAPSVRLEEGVPATVEWMRQGVAEAVG